MQLRAFHAAALIAWLASVARAQVGSNLISGASLARLPSVELHEASLLCGGLSQRRCVDGDVRTIAGGPDRRFAVVGSKDNVVIHGFRSGDIHLGGKGSGPGEWRAIGAIAVHDDGGIVLYDPVLQRLTTFARPSGDAHNTKVLSRPPGYHSARFAADALFLLSEYGAEHENISITLRDLASGKLVTTIPVAQAHIEKSTEQLDLRPIPPLFGPRILWDVTRNGVAILAHRQEAVLAWFNAKGLLQSVTLAIPPAPVTKDDITRERERLLPPTLPRSMEATVRPQVDAAARRAYKVHQVVRSIVATADGGAWVATRAQGDTDNTWYRFNANGTPEYRLVLSATSQVAWADKRHIAILATESDGESSLTLWSWRLAS